jgi:hypothetical protein
MPISLQALIIEDNPMDADLTFRQLVHLNFGRSVIF